MQYIQYSKATGEITATLFSHADSPSVPEDIGMLTFEERVNTVGKMVDITVTPPVLVDAPSPPDEE